MPFSASQLTCCTVNGLIYLFGGDSITGNRKDSYSFNPVTGEYRKLGDMIYANRNFGIAVLKDGVLGMMLDILFFYGRNGRCFSYYIL